jgi:hypothetical protein
MKSYGLLLSVLGLVVGCSPSWKDTGQQGPWCAPNAQARVFCSELVSVAGPQQDQRAYESKSGVKHSEVSFLHELDEYFSKCTFISQWPARGTINSVRQHKSPFDLCFVSMEPTVIVGVERQDPKVSALDSPARKKCLFLSSTHLTDFIQVRTTLPYHVGAGVVWFSPAEDHDLHRIDLGTGTATFTIGEVGQITVAVEGGLLITSRK